jgi:UDP-GlcNAc:undecaprenyl-phosphate/decaprenyl-phosphate GlcNAc-1-phosphate transferase
VNGEEWIAVAAVASGITAALVPASIRLAHRMGLLDLPVGWKQHSRATPYLGGAAVFAGLLVSTLLFAPDLGHVAAILWVAPLLLVVGVVDDRFTLRATPRVLIELGAGAVLWKSGLGWQLHAGDAVNLALTMFWVTAVINAVNLLDLMDGVASAVAAAIAAGCAALAASNGDESVAVLAVATAAACLTFLPFNLSSPARIFLGDGGTMPLGFVLAALATAGFSNQAESVGSLAIAACLVGVPLFDMAVRVVVRRASGIPLLTAGPDSLANRLHDVVGTPRLVALVLGLAQLTLSALAVGIADSDAMTAVALFAVALCMGAWAAVFLHRAGARQAPVSLAASND